MIWDSLYNLPPYTTHNYYPTGPGTGQYIPTPEYGAPKPGAFGALQEQAQGFGQGVLDLWGNAMFAGAPYLYDQHRQWREGYDNPQTPIQVPPPGSVDPSQVQPPGPQIPDVPPPAPPGGYPALSPQDEAMWNYAENAQEPPPPAQPEVGPMPPPPMAEQPMVPQGPSPFEMWMADYDAETQKLVDASKMANKRAMFADMAKAFSNIGDYGAQLGGVADAAKTFGVNKASIEGMPAARESAKLDDMVKFGQFSKYMRPDKETTSFAEKRAMIRMQMVMEAASAGEMTPEAAKIEIESILGAQYEPTTIGGRPALIGQHGQIIIDGRTLSPDEAAAASRADRIAESYGPEYEKDEIFRAEYEARVAWAMENGAKDEFMARVMATEKNKNIFDFLYPGFPGVRPTAGLDRAHAAATEVDEWARGQYMSEQDRADWESLTPEQKEAVRRRMEGGDI